MDGFVAATWAQRTAHAEEMKAGLPLPGGALWGAGGIHVRSERCGGMSCLSSAICPSAIMCLSARVRVIFASLALSRLLALSALAIREWTCKTLVMRKDAQSHAFMSVWMRALVSCRDALFPPVCALTSCLFALLPCLYVLLLFVFDHLGATAGGEAGGVSGKAVEPPDLSGAQVLGGTNGPVVEGEMGACIDLGKASHDTGKASRGRVASRIGPWA